MNKAKTSFIAWVITINVFLFPSFLSFLQGIHICSWISSIFEHYCGLTQDLVWITTQIVLFDELLISVKTIYEIYDCLFGIMVGLNPV